MSSACRCLAWAAPAAFPGFRSRPAWRTRGPEASCCWSQLKYALWPCVLRADEAGIAAVEMSGQHTWPDTLDIMGWNVDPQGFGVVFDRAIPPFAEAHIAPAVTGILGRAGLGLADIDRFACHPGGSKVITALERALSLEQGSLDHERAVLADYGNMSAPTALFVLDRLIQAGLPPRTLLTAMGPGFTASCVSLKRAA
jgi:alkylresorcinol/alkylpyrone synthase